jgi:hypothetical protein
MIYGELIATFRPILMMRCGISPVYDAVFLREAFSLGSFGVGMNRLVSIHEHEDIFLDSRI